MGEIGFIKIYRSLITWEWYSDIKTKTLFLHLLLTANFEDKKWQGVTIKRGQRVFSYEKLSKETGLTVQVIRTGIKKLISTGEITYMATAKFSIATLNNYEKYQGVTCDVTGGQQTDNKLLTSKQQQLKKERNKEIKNTNTPSYLRAGEEKGNYIDLYGKLQSEGKDEE